MNQPSLAVHNVTIIKPKDAKSASDVSVLIDGKKVEGLREWTVAMQPSADGKVFVGELALKIVGVIAFEESSPEPAPDAPLAQDSDPQSAA